MIELDKDQANDIPFMMIDTNGDPVTGLGSGITVTLRKEAGSFAASAGTKSELSNGWYNYRATAGECDTTGSLAIRITGAGARTQNLVVKVVDIPAEVWANTTRSLTQTAAQVADILTGTTLSLPRATTWTITLTGLGDISTRSKLWFTLKERKTDADTSAIVQIEEAAGLIYSNGAAGTSGNGSITVDDENAGDITIVVAAAETTGYNLADRMYYDVKALLGTNVTSLTRARARIIWEPTLAVS